MITIEARNVNDALWAGGSMLRQMGVQRDSRNGPVLVAPAPVSTVYMNPTERVMLHPGRDANPFFHLVEALWMLAGRNDLAALTEFVKNMANFSDDGGKTQPGAYGFRWRHQFDYRKGKDLDQLAWAIKRLKADPDDRRVVIQMWDPAADAYAADNGGKDVPCNLIALPSIGTDGRLNLTVYNRSNDMVWGAYGANAVHFSVLQEYLAAMVGVPVGCYWQVANNFHGYLATLGKAGAEWPWGQSGLVGSSGQFLPDPYGSGAVKPMPMFGDGLTQEEVLDDIEMFLREPARDDIRSAFLRQVACPMVMAHRAYKRWGGLDGVSSAREVLEQMPADNDWRAGATLWLNNREAKLTRETDDGVTHEDQV